MSITMRRAYHLRRTPRSVATPRAAVPLHIKTDMGSRIVPFRRQFEGYALTGLVEIEPGCAGTFTNPGYGPIATVLEIYINGSVHEAGELVDPKVIALIEHETLTLANHEGRADFLTFDPRKLHRPTSRW